MKEKIFWFFAIFLCFFVKINTLYADYDNFTCEYTDTANTNSYNDRVSVNIAIYQPNSDFYAWKKSEVKYSRWDGVDKKNTKKDIYNFTGDWWDLYIFKNQKCPSYLYALKDGNTYYDVAFTTEEKDFYSSTFKGYKKLKSANTVDFTQVYEPRSLATPSDSNPLNYIYKYSYSFSDKFDDNFYAHSVENVYNHVIELEKGQVATVYFFEDPFVNTLNLEDTDIDCKQDGFQSTYVSIDKPQTIDRVANANNLSFIAGFYFKIHADNITAENSTIPIKCTVTKPIKHFINKAKGSYNQIFYVKVKPPKETPKSYNIKNMTCSYTLDAENESGKYEVTDIIINVEGYNDGNIDSNTKVTFKYKSESGTMLDADSTSNKKTYTPFLRKTSTMKPEDEIKFNFKGDKFANYINAVNSGAACPNLYTTIDHSRKKDTYIIDLDSKGTLALNTLRGETDSNGKYKSYKFDRNDKTFSIPVFFYNDSYSCEKKQYIGGIKFSSGGNDILNYDIEIYKAKDNLKEEKSSSVSGNIKQNSYNSYDELKVFTNLYGSESRGSNTYADYIRIQSKILETIRDCLKGTISCDSQDGTIGNKKYKTINDRTINNTTQGTEYFTIYYDNINLYGNNSFDKCGEEEGDGIIEGTKDETNILEYAREKIASKTSELELINGSNDSNLTTDQWCEKLFAGEVGSIISTVILGIRIAVPVLLILLSMIEFIKAINDSDKMPTAKKNTIIRLIIGFAVFLLPSILKLVFNIADLPSCSDIF